MAHNVARRIEEEADRKGLEGERRKQYIGGAWDRVLHGEQRRTAERERPDYKALQALGMAVSEIRYPKSTGKLRHKGHVVHFRSGKSWYELPEQEYNRLVREGKRAQRDDQRRQAEYAKGEKVFARDLARLEKEEERERRRAERAERHKLSAQQAEEQTYRRLKRAEYRAVLHYIQQQGGIIRGKVQANGRDVERGEYNALPGNVKRNKLRQGRGGLQVDVMAQQLNEHMPWLFPEGTSREVYDFFDKHRVQRMHGQAA